MAAGGLRVNMKNVLVVLALAAVLIGPASASVEGADGADALEKRVMEIVASKDVTIVHLWAPWCGNCRAEMVNGGWAKFAAANPETKIVFINIWHRGMDPAPKLEDGGLKEGGNLLLLTHPNPSSKAADRLGRFLDLPITWIPTTWIFREGKMRFAFNYGEMRFDILQTLVNDSRSAWQH